MIRPLYFLPLVLFFLNGCSAIQSTDFRDFLSDTEVDDSQVADGSDPAQQAIDPVLESTRRALESNPLPATTEAKNSPLANELNIEPEFDNVWMRLPAMYEFSDIDNKRIEIQKKKILRHKKDFTKISKRAEPFLFFITEEVEKRNMPGEIALLPIIESAFKTQAYSRQKAAGLWQFVPATGRHFGLKQNWWFDGRKDVYLSTHAALTYLKQLNKYYKGDWLLALAAYNAGAGNVNKAVRKNRKKGKPIDYWSLDLPRETKKYVPKLIAVAQLIKEHQKKNIRLHQIDNEPKLKRVDIKSQIDLALVTKTADISLKEFKLYNPAFKQWATDPDGPHQILLPIDKVNLFESQLAMVDEKDRVKLHVRHKIRSGESLSVIARKYNISVKALKHANHLKSNRIRAGKYLLLPVPEDYKLASASQASNKVYQLKNTKNGKTYTVQKGDSFWTIARRFNMPHRKLVSLNGMSSSDTLSIGQVLLVRTEVTADKATRSNPKHPTKEISYKVKQGDSLYVISKRFKVSINELKRWNSLSSKKYLQPGQELKLYVSSTSSQTI